MEQIPNVWSSERAKVKVEKINSLAPGAATEEHQQPAPASKSGTSAQSPAAKKPGEPTPKSTPAASPKNDGKVFPRPNQPALKPDVTLRRDASERERAQRQVAEQRAAAEQFFFVSEPPIGAESAPVDVPAEKPAEKS